MRYIYPIASSFCLVESLHVWINECCAGVCLLCLAVCSGSLVLGRLGSVIGEETRKCIPCLTGHFRAIISSWLSEDVHNSWFCLKHVVTWWSKYVNIINIVQDISKCVFQEMSCLHYPRDHAQPPGAFLVVDWLIMFPWLDDPFLMNRKTKTSIHPEMFINVYQMLDLAWLGEFKYWLIHVNPHFVGHNDDMWKTHPGRVAELRGLSTGRSWGSSAQEGLENASCNGRFRQKIRAGSVSKCIIIGYQKCI